MKNLVESKCEKLHIFMLIGFMSTMVIVSGIVNYLSNTPEVVIIELIQAIPLEFFLVITVVFIGRLLGIKKMGFEKPLFNKFYWLIPEVLLIIVSIFSMNIKFEIVSIKTMVSLGILAIMVGIYEEFLSRGVVLHIFARMGKVEWAIIGSGFIFGMLHFSNFNGFNSVEIFQQIIETFAAGVYAAVITLSLRSIIPLIVTHFIYDFLLFIKMYFAECFHEDMIVKGSDQVSLLFDITAYIIPIIYLIIAMIIFYFEKDNIKEYQKELLENVDEKIQYSKLTIIQLVIIISVIIVGFNLFFMILK